MRYPALILAPLLVLACKAEDPPATTTATKTSETCNVETLTQLGESFERTPPFEHETHATVSVAPMGWNRFGKMCWLELPRPVIHYFDHMVWPKRPTELDREALAELVEKVCPGAREIEKALADTAAGQRAAAVHAGCKLDRFEVFTGAERRAATSVAITTDDGLPVVAFVVHQWLLDLGLDSAKARPITRALYALEVRRRSPVQVEGVQAWAKAPGVPFEPGLTIHVTFHDVQIEGKTVVRIHEGDFYYEGDEQEVYRELGRQAYAAKREAEARGEEWDARLIVAAHARTPATTVISVVDAAKRAGFEHFSLAVESTVDGYYAQIPISAATIVPLQ